MEKDDQTPEPDFANRLNQIPQLINKLRSLALGGVNVLVEAETHTLNHELDHKTKKFGADSVQVQELKRRISVHRGLRTQLQAETQRAEITVPEPRPDYFIIHGRVINTDGLGIPGLTVSGVDSEKQSIIHYVCTDKRGYFKLEFSCIHEESDVEERRGEERGNAKDRHTQVFLQISDQNRTVLHRTDETFLLIPGSIEYREIELSDQQTESCVPPLET